VPIVDPEHEPELRSTTATPARSHQYRSQGSCASSVAATWSTSSAWS